MEYPTYGISVNLKRYWNGIGFDKMQLANLSFLLSTIFLYVQVVIPDDKISDQPGTGLRFAKTNKPKAKTSARLLPLVESDFKEIIKNGNIFVDKTEWIRRAIEYSRHIDVAKPPGFVAIARPRGFGKSINLSMLRYFLDSSMNSSHLFTGLEISKAKHQSFRQHHQNKYVVFYFDFNTEGKLGVLEEVKNVLTQQVKNNRQLLLNNSNFDKIQKWLKIHPVEHGPLLEAYSALCSALAQAKRKFVVLVDNADKPYLPAFIKGELLTDDGGILAQQSIQVLELMHTIYWRFFRKSDHQPVLGVMIGTTLVPDPIELDSKNLQKGPIFEDDFSSDFGFTDDEVRDLILDAGSDMVITNARAWYKGYHFGENAIYSPVSVVNALSNGKFKPFWCEKTDGQLLGDLIKKGGFYARLQLGVIMDDVALEKPVLKELEFSKVRDKETTFWTYLVHAGFLDVNRTKEQIASALVRLPNFEVKEYLGNRFIKTLPHKDLEYKNFTEGLLISNKTDYTDFQNVFRELVKRKCAFFGPSEMKEHRTIARYVTGLLAGISATHRTVQVTDKQFSDVFVYGKEHESVVALRFVALKGDDVAAGAKWLHDVDPKDPTSDEPRRPKVLRVVFPVNDDIMVGVFDEKSEDGGFDGLFGDYSDMLAQSNEDVMSGYINDVISGYPDNPPRS